MNENELDLREIKKLLIAYKEDYINVHKVLREVNDWHIRERKKWALGLLDKLYGTKDDILAEIRKRIEEG